MSDSLVEAFERWQEADRELRQCRNTFGDEAVYFCADKALRWEECEADVKRHFVAQIAEATKKAFVSEK